MSNKRKRGQKRESGLRSSFEETLINAAERNGMILEYEPFSVPYTIQGRYTPDFRLPNGILIEAKGFFDQKARAKMAAVKKANPRLDIRLVFMNSNTKVRKGSRMSYADWSEKYGFPFADKTIPLDWFLEDGKETES